MEQVWSTTPPPIIAKGHYPFKPLLHYILDAILRMIPFPLAWNSNFFFFNNTHCTHWLFSAHNCEGPVFLVKRMPCYQFYPFHAAVYYHIYCIPPMSNKMKQKILDSSKGNWRIIFDEAYTIMRTASLSFHSVFFSLTGLSVLFVGF